MALGILLATSGSISFAQDEPNIARTNHLPPAERRAIAYLAKEVPAWRPANRCFSCHNNGDGARAIFVAASVGVQLDTAVTKETSEFLAKPHLWDTNGPDGEFNDRQLARLQFANALAAAVAGGFVRDRQPLVAAAQILVTDQNKDGAWEFTGADEMGSPVTYGRPLATAIALRVLRQADPQRFAHAIAAAESWLSRLEPVSVLTAAAILHGLDKSTKESAVAQRARCLSMLRRSQTSDGGWGPYVNSAPEPFDTAVVLGALATSTHDEWPDAIRKGRTFLEQTQHSDGSWPETTRPPGQESYAQRISTSAWATIALLATRNIDHKGKPKTP